MTRRGINFQSPVNWSHPLNCGLASWWLVRPDLVRGNTWYDLCGRNHGTLSNLTPSSAWVSAPLSRGAFGAIDVTGGTNTGIPATAVVGDTELSRTFVVRFVADAFNTTDARVAPLHTGTNPDCALCFTTGPVARFRIHANGTITNCDGTTTLSTGTEYFVVGTSAGLSGTIYVNGVSDGTATATFSGARLRTGVYIGGRGSGAIAGFDGRVIECRIIDRALSASEVWALYQDSCQGYPGTLARLRRRRACVFAGGGGGGGNTGNFFLTP